MDLHGSHWACLGINDIQRSGIIEETAEQGELFYSAPLEQGTVKLHCLIWGRQQLAALLLMRADQRSHANELMALYPQAQEASRLPVRLQEVRPWACGSQAWLRLGLAPGLSIYCFDTLYFAQRDSYQTQQESPFWLAGFASKVRLCAPRHPPKLKACRNAAPDEYQFRSEILAITPCKFGSWAMYQLEVATRIEGQYGRAIVYAACHLFGENTPAIGDGICGRVWIQGRQCP
jgi:hypothetical protein